jgi:hypothetical protein
MPKATLGKPARVSRLERFDHRCCDDIAHTDVDPPVLVISAAFSLPMF